MCFRIGHLQPLHGFQVCQQDQMVPRVQEHQQFQEGQELQALHGHPVSLKQPSEI